MAHPDRGNEAKVSKCFGCGEKLTATNRSDHLDPSGPHGKITSR
jgi:hypothetical protein